LRKHGATAGGDTSSSKRQKTAEPTVTTSAFQELFAQRAQGFQIDFRFRNAPPRPPVGPCFVGNSLDSVLAEQSRQYKPHNAVEGNHTWKLHCESDIGVPLAPSAMDIKSYVRPDENSNVKLHPDDDALLNWTGSMGDTAAEDLKRRQEQARAAARLAVSTRSPASVTKATSVLQSQTDKNKKKIFSRVLKEDMQTWMKKTTYLSNDYSRKVHDFKSLAQTKSDVATDLQTKQIEMSGQRSVKTISESFDFKKPLENPTNKQLKAVRIMQVLPDVSNWGRAFTHVVIDKIPTNLPAGHSVDDYRRSLITNVEKRQANARMTCNLIAPTKDPEISDKDLYRPIQSYDLDVVPLKEEDLPHMNFTIWLDTTTNVAYYIPIASRVQLSMGRPSISKTLQPIERRTLTDKEKSDMEERMAEIDQDMAVKHHVTKTRDTSSELVARSNGEGKGDTAEDDDGEGDFGDDDSNEEEEVFGRGTRTIVAES
jgi:Paf1